MHTNIRTRAGALFTICAASLLTASAALAHEGCGAHQSRTSLFGPFDVEVGDTVKFNLVAPPGARDGTGDPGDDSTGGPGDDSAPTTTPVTVRIFGADGSELGTITRHLAPGAIDTVELGRLPPDGTGRTSLWATVSTAPPDDGRPVGNQVAVQLEISDSESSQFLSPATLVGFNPQPEPPGRPR